MAQPPVENRFTNETGQITSNPGMAQQPIQNRFTDETGQVTSIPGSPATLRDDHVPPSDRRSSSPHDNVSATLLASSSGAVEQDNVSEDSDSDWEAAQDFLRGIPFGPYAWRSLDRHEEMITCESDHVNMRYSIDEIMEVYKAIQAKLREQGGAPQDSSDLEEAVDRVDEEIRAAGGFRHWCEPDKLKKTAVNELSKEFTNAFFTKQLRRRDGAKGGIPNTPPGTPPNNERNVDDNPNAANPSPLPWGLRFWNSPADPVKECFKCLLKEHHILVYIEIYKAIHKRAEDLSRYRDEYGVVQIRPYTFIPQAAVDIEAEMIAAGGLEPWCKARENERDAGRAELGRAFSPHLTPIGSGSPPGRIY